MDTDDNAPFQYKNKHVFRFYQKLADEFNLRIIRTYGAAGHGKGVIDAMSSFGAKNILRHDIVTLDAFFNSSESIVDYLAKKKPQFSYTNVPAHKVALQRFKLKQDPLEIKDCMKQHLFIFEKGKYILLKEYLCDCNHCFNFKFECCEESKYEGSSEVITDDDLFADEDEELNKEEQIFDFVEVPSYVTLFTGVNTEPLYFLKVKEKGVSDGTITDTWGHVVLPGARYFKGNYLKPVRSRNMSFKKFDILPLDVVITPEEIFDTYVDINENMLLGINLYNSLIQKAKS